MYSVKIRHRILLYCTSAAAMSLATALIAAPLTIYNTGVDNFSAAWGSGGVPDIHYSLIAQPGSGIAQTVTDTAYPFPPWLANNYGSPGSRWIGPAADANGPAGNYVYRTTFNVPNNAVLSSVSITGDWASDDPGTDIKINGTSTGQTSASYSALTPFSINSGFVLGTNTLDFFVTNAFNFINPTGLRVDHIAGSYQIPEPTALALGCGGLIVGLVLRRRRRC
jgi:hypothetical protein